MPNSGRASTNARRLAKWQNERVSTRSRDCLLQSKGDRLAMAGYSGTPLAMKLGIKAGTTVLTVDAPGAYFKLLAPLPESVRFVTRLSKSVDLLHLFVTRRSKFEASLASFRGRMRPDAAVWASWPKKSSKVETDI